MTFSITRPSRTRLELEYWNWASGLKVFLCFMPYASTPRGVNERYGSLSRSCTKSASAVYGNRPLRIPASWRSVIRSPLRTPGT